MKRFVLFVLCVSAVMSSAVAEPRKPGAGAESESPPFYSLLSLTAEQQESLGKLRAAHRKKELKLLKDGRFDPYRLNEQIDLNSLLMFESWKLLTIEQKREWLKHAKRVYSGQTKWSETIDGLTEEQVFAIYHINASFTPPAEVVLAKVYKLRDTINQGKEHNVEYPATEKEFSRLDKLFWDSSIRVKDETRFILTDKQKLQLDVATCKRLLREELFDIEKASLPDETVAKLLPAVQRFADAVAPTEKHLKNVDASLANLKKMLQQQKLIGGGERHIRFLEAQIEASKELRDELSDKWNMITDDLVTEVKAILTDEQQDLFWGCNPHK